MLMTFRCLWWIWFLGGTACLLQALGSRDPELIRQGFLMLMGLAMGHIIGIWQDWQIRRKHDLIVERDRAAKAEAEEA